VGADRQLYIGNVMLLVLNLPLVGLWVKLLKIPKPQLYAGILIFATVGVYGMRQSAFDLLLLYAIGLLGVLMRRFDFPTAPVVVGMILGPLAEAQMRNALSIGEGSWRCSCSGPMSLTLLIIGGGGADPAAGDEAARREAGNGLTAPAR
jgi:putative tricarboxylic transport membrane protein